MQEAIAAGKTVRAGLTEPIPMYLLYWTAFVDANGGVHFREDIYDWDARLIAALDGAGAAGVRGALAEAGGSVVGSRERPERSCIGR